VTDAAIGWEASQLLHRATALTDAGQWDELAALYTEDATMARPSDPGRPIIGREAILHSFSQRPPRTTRHVLSNLIVDIISADEVRIRSVVTLFAGPPPVGPGPVPAAPAIMVGGFDDLLRRTADGWRIAVRSGSMALEYRPS
jgi:hypothetical protein